MTTAPPYRKTFVAGCPRSGTTWVFDIFKRFPKAITTMESSPFDFLLGDRWWRDYMKRQRGMRDRWLNLQEAVLVRKKAWYPHWRRSLISYFKDHQSFILHHAKLRASRTWATQLRGRLIPYRHLLTMIDEVEREAPDAPHADKVERVARRIFDAHFLRQGGTEEHVLIEKSPSHFFHAEYILDHFPEAGIIEVLRDGRDVLVSMDSYAPMPKNRELQSRLWTLYVRQGLELRQKEEIRDRILTIRYEELKADPPGQIQRMAAFAGLDDSIETAQRIADETDIRKIEGAGEGKHYRKGVVGDWQGRLGVQDLATFKTIAGDSFTAAGYSW